MPRKRVTHPSKRLSTGPRPVGTGSTPSAVASASPPHCHRPLAGPTRAELAKIHIAKRDLRLTDELYRGFMKVLFGRGSARDLTHEQVEELLEHFKSLGWKSEYTKSETGRKQSEPATSLLSHRSGRKPATMAQIGLIVYLWERGPGIRHKSIPALNHFLNHHFHITELKQVRASQVPGILGAIKNMGKM